MLCEGQPDDTAITHPYSCTEYITCIGGQFAERRSCHPGFVFDGQYCVMSSTYNCTVSNKIL